MGADFFNAIETMKDRLDANAVAAQVPMGAEDNFWGVIDLVTMTAWDFKADDKGMTYPEPMDEIPAEFADIAATKREELLDAAASFDDELMEKILMEEDFTVEELKAALRKGVLANELNLVFVGSAYKNKGRPGAARRCRRLPAEPARRRGCHRYRSGYRRGDRASSFLRRALLRPGLQDHDRPVRR